MGKRVLTYSSTSAFKACRRKYQYAYVDQIKPKEEPRPLRFGSVFHTALEMYYRGETPGAILDKIDELFSKVEIDPLNTELQMEVEQDRELVKTIYGRYIQHYACENIQPILLESQGEVPILNPKTGRPSRNWTFRFKVDGVVQDSNGFYWIIEHKTASQINTQYIKSLTMDTQCVAYIDAIRRTFPLDIKGVIYNVVLKDAPKPPALLKKGGLSIAKNQNTTAELFRDAIIENGLDEADYAEHLEWLEANQKQFFYREWLVFPEELIQEWRQEIWQIAQDVREAEKKKAWYKNTAQCTKYGICQYFDICTAIDRDIIIELNFLKKESDHEELTELPEASSF